MENKIVLVTGGARSGKSAFSERFVRENSSRYAYIATCPVLDEEMRERVKVHRERRKGFSWIDIEEQLDLTGALERAAAENADGVLIDCLTLWVNNLMYHFPDFNEKILFLEARSGQVPQMTMFFSQLQQTGAFDKIKGLILGTFTQMEAASKNIVPLALRYVKEDLPVFWTLEAGHGTDSRAVIIGGHAVTVSESRIMTKN